jgi:hypothetical protein
LGEGDREGGERFRAPAVGEKVPGGGVGTRTADCRTTGSDMVRSQRHRRRQMRGRGVGKKHRRRGGEVLQLDGVAKESSGMGHVREEEGQLQRIWQFASRIIYQPRLHMN